MDSSWQSIATVVATIVAIISLLFSVFIEREKSSKLYSEVLTQLESILRRLRQNIPPAIVHSLTIILNALFLFLLAYFILVAPIFLYEEFHQSTHVVSSDIDRNSIFYGLVIIVWCLCIMLIIHKFAINKLQDQIDFLNRIPGIKELKNNYNSQLFDSAIRQWNDFSAELLAKHDDSAFAIDLADCSPIDVRDEILIIGCPNRVIHKRMNRKVPSSTTGYDEEYEAWKVDKESIEKIVKERFQVRRISYMLAKQITS